LNCEPFALQTRQRPQLQVRDSIHDLEILRLDFYLCLLANMLIVKPVAEKGQSSWRTLPTLSSSQAHGSFEQ
jgi:hypothetical protein